MTAVSIGHPTQRENQKGSRRQDQAWWDSKDAALTVTPIPKRPFTAANRALTDIARCARCSAAFVGGEALVYEPPPASALEGQASLDRPEPANILLTDLTGIVENRSSWVAG
jgi:hypothetical protein